MLVPALQSTWEQRKIRLVSKGGKLALKTLFPKPFLLIYSQLEIGLKAFKTCRKWIYVVTCKNTRTSVLISVHNLGISLSQHTHTVATEVYFRAIQNELRAYDSMKGVLCLCKLLFGGKENRRCGSNVRFFPGCLECRKRGLSEQNKISNQQSASSFCVSISAVH